MAGKVAEEETVVVMMEGRKAAAVRVAGVQMEAVTVAVVRDVGATAAARAAEVAAGMVASGRR